MTSQCESCGATPANIWLEEDSSNDASEQSSAYKWPICAKCWKNNCWQDYYSHYIDSNGNIHYDLPDISDDEDENE